MNQTKVTQNPHFAIDFGRVRDFGDELGRAAGLVLGSRDATLVSGYYVSATGAAGRR